MRVKSTDPISADEFRHDLDKYLRAAQNGAGPVAVACGSKIAGFFISALDYEALYGKAVKRLLASRMKGPTLSHEETCARVQRRLRQVARKS